MSTDEGHTIDLLAGVFEKLKHYFDERFDAISIPITESTSIKELRNKLEAKALERPGNIEKFEFCGKIEIAS